MRKDLEVLTRVRCANTPLMLANLNRALQHLGLSGKYQVVNIERLPSTDHRTGYPTPTLLYGNRDLFGLPEPVPPFPEPA